MNELRIERVSGSFKASSWSTVTSRRFALDFEDSEIRSFFYKKKCILVVEMPFCVHLKTTTDLVCSSNAA